MRPEGPTAVEAAVGAVAVRDEALLMVRRGHGPAGGTWSIPGGRIEPGEAVAEAVVRELTEETGLLGVCGPFMGWIELIDDEGHFLVLDFEVIILDDGDPVAGGDAAEVAWIPLIDVPELTLAPGLADFLADHDVIELLA